MPSDGGVSQFNEAGSVSQSTDPGIQTCVAPVAVVKGRIEARTRAQILHQRGESVL